MRALDSCQLACVARTLKSVVSDERISITVALSVFSLNLSPVAVLLQKLLASLENYFEYYTVRKIGNYVFIGFLHRWPGSCIKFSVLPCYATAWTDKETRLYRRSFINLGYIGWRSGK